MIAGSTDERRLLADVRSGREALQSMAASLKTLTEGSEPRSAVEARLEVALGALIKAGITANLLSGAIQHVGVASVSDLHLDDQQLRDALTLATALAGYEVKA